MVKVKDSGFKAYSGIQVLEFAAQSLGLGFRVRISSRRLG